MPDILVVGSLNTDFIVRTTRCSIPGETIGGFAYKFMESSGLPLERPMPTRTGPRDPGLPRAVRSACGMLAIKEDLERFIGERSGHP